MIVGHGVDENDFKKGRVVSRTMTKEEVCQLGQEIYDRDIRQLVESENEGRYVVVDVMTGDYAIADSVLSACDLARARNADAILYLVRVGFPSVYRIGVQKLEADGLVAGHPAG